MSPEFKEAYSTNLVEDLPLAAPQQALYFFLDPHGQTLFLAIFCSYLIIIITSMHLEPTPL